MSGTASGGREAHPEPLTLTMPLTEGLLAGGRLVPGAQHLYARQVRQQGNLHQTGHGRQRRIHQLCSAWSSALLRCVVIVLPASRLATHTRPCPPALTVPRTLARAVCGSHHRIIVEPRACESAEKRAEIRGVQTCAAHKAKSEQAAVDRGLASAGNCHPSSSYAHCCTNAGLMPNGWDFNKFSKGNSCRGDGDRDYVTKQVQCTLFFECACARLRAIPGRAMFSRRSRRRRVSQSRRSRCRSAKREQACSQLLRGLGRCLHRSPTRISLLLIYV